MKLVVTWVALAIAVSAAPAAAGAAASTAPAANTTLARDSTLASLVREALAQRPELAQALETARADSARVTQVRALPDPVLSLGIQNDGFNGLQIGKMELSYWSIVAAQTFPLAGKRGLRGEAQTLGARQSAADLDRARLTAQAEVERAYLDLIEARDQLRILARLEVLWSQAEGQARARYETGDGAQSDVLRAQLERSRLEQQRWALAAEERRRLAVLNRASGRPLDTPLATALSLGALADPALPDSNAALADAMSRSPELRKAGLATQQSRTLESLAHRDYWPDLTVSGGVMPRGGTFDPMWQAGVAFSIPLWAGGKQSSAVHEYRARGEAAQSGAEAVRRLLAERLEERRALLSALIETNRLYRAGVLIQSEATVSSAMAQYQVGRVPFASVLEALRGYLSDELGFFGSVAAAQRIDIATRELSLEAIAGSALGGLGGGTMPGSGGGMNALPAGIGGAAPTAPGGNSTASAMPKM